MEKGHISIYKKDVSIIKIKKNDVNLFNCSSLPCVCKAGSKLFGIAIEYIKDEEVYLVDISKNKIFASKKFKKESLPQEQGAPICVNLSGEITGSGEPPATIQEIGYFLGLENGAVLFMLQ